MSWQDLFVSINDGHCVRTSSSRRGIVSDIHIQVATSGCGTKSLWFEVYHYCSDCKTMIDRDKLSCHNKEHKVNQIIHCNHDIPEEWLLMPEEVITARIAKEL